MSADTPYLSVAITAYNEARRIEPTLRRIVGYLEQQDYSYEIVVNDDGSRDETAAIIKAFQALRCSNLTLLVAARNQGKGAGVRRAVLHSRGRYILFTDADLSTPIEEVSKLLAKLQGPYEIAIGSRIQHDGSDMRVSQPILRRLVGKTYHFVAALLVVRGIRDTQAGFKCFRREAAHRLFAMSSIDSIIFDVEILYLAKKLGYRVAEVPVFWTNAAGSRMRVTPKHALTVFGDILRIKWLHRRVARLGEPDEPCYERAP